MTFPGGENESVRELLATVLHEVRTPLACLTTTVDVLIAAYPDLPIPDTVEMLRRVQRSASWLQNLIDNLTIAAQVESHQLHLRYEDISLRDCLDTAIALVAPLLERSGQSMILDGELDAKVHGDSRRIEQVLVNLVMNASKYGGRDRPIKVTVRPDGLTIRVEVSDRGPGVASEEQSRIFERYQRGLVAAEQGTAGLGLGLHIVKTLVERQGGQVGVASRLGEGATFWFVLPSVARHRRLSRRQVAPTSSAVVPLSD